MTITAKENMILTNGEVYAQSVRLGDWDSPDNWEEIPVAEYEKLLERRAKESTTI